MAPPTKSQPAGERKDDQDLKTLLDVEQRAELTLLIAYITESMRKLISENFEATASLLARNGLTEDEKMMATDPASADVEKYDKQKKLKEEYVKDLSTDRMKDLKSNALKAYDTWREQVIQRVGQVVNDEKTAKSQMNETKQNKNDTKPRPRAPQNVVGKITEIPARKANPNLKFKDLFPPHKTPLTKLTMSERTLIVHSVLLLLLSLEHYLATSRILLLNLTSSLKLPLRTFEQDEYVTAKGLLEGVKELSASKEIEKRVQEGVEMRKRNVNYATIAGAAIMGVAGGLAAPLVGAGISSVATGLGLGTTAAAGYLGSVASSSLVVGSLFGAYGGRMTGQMMDKYAREVEDFEFLRVHQNHEAEKTSEDPEKGAQQASDHDHKLRVTICISGWLTEKEEVLKPWRVLGTGSEVFALKFELEALLNLGNAMDGLVQSAAWGYAQKELIQRTIFADLMAAMWPIGLLKVAQAVDNPFNLAKSRAEKAGEVLADALVNRCQGERPVTLIGYSLGARAIYMCLQSLAKRKAFNLVENVVLMGSPTPSDTSDWRAIRSVVSGRLVNVYSTNDYLLGLLYRTSAIQYGVAGLQPVEGLTGVENVDVSENVDGHLRYRFLVGSILKQIGFEDIDMDAVEEEQVALKKMIEEEKKNSLNAQRKRLLRQESFRKENKKIDDDKEAEHEASDIEKQAREKTEQSLVSRVIEWWYTPRVPNIKVGENTIGNISNAVKNPSQTGKVLGETATDVQSSASDMAQRVYAALPSMPYMRKVNTTQQASTNVSKTTQEAKETTSKAGQSYTEMAQSYYQSLPTMPSISQMPSVSIPGYSSKPKKPPTSKPAQVTKTTGETAKSGINAVTDAAGTTVKNTANINDNPATKQIKKAPIIHQAVDKDPGITQGLGKVTGIIGSSVSKVTDTATGAVNKTTDGAGKAGGKAVDTIDSKAKQAGQKLSNNNDNQIKDQQTHQQSYTSYAASYLSSMPSLPTWNRKVSGKQAPPKLERKNSSQQATKAAPPKLQRNASSQQNVKSTPPKLGARKVDEIKSQQQTPSGVKSPPPKLGRTPSAAQNIPGTESLKQLGQTPQQAAGQVIDGGKSAAQKGNEAVGQVAGQGQAAAKKGGEAAGQVASRGQQALKSGSDAATKAAGGLFGGAKKMAGF